MKNHLFDAYDAILNKPSQIVGTALTILITESVTEPVPGLQIHLEKATKLKKLIKELLFWILGSIAAFVYINLQQWLDFVPLDSLYIILIQLLIFFLICVFLIPSTLKNLNVSIFFADNGNILVFNGSRRTQAFSFDEINKVLLLHCFRKGHSNNRYSKSVLMVQLKGQNAFIPLITSNKVFFDLLLERLAKRNPIMIGVDEMVTSSSIGF